MTGLVEPEEGSRGSSTCGTMRAATAAVDWVHQRRHEGRRFRVTYMSAWAHSSLATQGECGSASIQEVRFRWGGATYDLGNFLQ